MTIIHNNNNMQFNNAYDSNDADVAVVKLVSSVCGNDNINHSDN